MIILTPTEAAIVRGYANPRFALEPRLLTGDATYGLPEEVLTDPGHADVKEFLSAITTGAGTLSATASASWSSAGARSVARFGYATDLHHGTGLANDATYGYADTLTKAQAIVTGWAGKGIQFVVFCGDTVDDQVGSTTPMLAALTEIVAAFAAAGVPVHYVCGNHDFYHITKAQYRAATGMSANYYYVDASGTRLIFLDACNKSDDDVSDYDIANYTVSGNTAYVGPAQRTWLTDTLASAPGKVVVFCHHQLKDVSDFYHVTNHAAVRSIIEAAGNVIAVICGHLHANASATINTIPYRTMEACLDGASPTNAYAVITVRGDKVHIKGYGNQTSYVT